MNKQGHKGLQVEDCGFIVSQQEGYLGMFPDGRVHDPSSDQLNGIIEINCPYTKRTQTPQQACDDPSFYCKFEQNVTKGNRPLLPPSTIAVVCIF